MARRVAGICYIKVDGTQLEVSGSIECSLADTTKEAVMAHSGNVGYKETPNRQFIKGSFIFMPDFPITTIVDGVDMSITAELANGKKFTLGGAFLEGAPSPKADDGTIDLEFTGRNGSWA